MTTAEAKLAKKRLSALELAQKLANVALACRQRGISRTQFYEYKRRFQTHGLEGLVDLPPIPKSHPNTTPPEVIEKILAHALEHPGHGCYRISDELQLQGISISGVTIQKILERNEMGSKYQRLLKLEEKYIHKKIPLTEEQVAAIERANPCFRERHVESKGPGALLSQDTFYVGQLKGVGKVYMQAVVDTFGSFAFASIQTGKRPEQAATVLHNDVLPQYKTWGIQMGAILTDNGREYCGREHHAYELYLALNDIEHRRTKVKSPKTNGFVERFNRTVLDEFFREAFRKTLYTSTDALQEDLNRWLHHYNYERPHRGYRNMGKRPFDTIKKHVKTVSKDT